DDELRERAHHDRIPEVTADARRLLQDLVEAVGQTDVAELRAEVADHPARHLVLVVERIVLGDLAQRLALARGDVAKVLGDGPESRVVDVDAEAQTPRV